jgi:Ras family protein A
LFPSHLLLSVLTFIKTFREPERPTRRASTAARLAFLRAAIPIPIFHRRPCKPGEKLIEGPLIERPETALGIRDDDNDGDGAAAEAKNPRRRGLFSLFSRKRKHRSPSPSALPPVPQVVLEVPLTIHFLFVGAKSAGQTSLLL